MTRWSDVQDDDVDGVVNVPLLAEDDGFTVVGKASKQGKNKRAATKRATVSKTAVEVTVTQNNAFTLLDQE
jgi:hypothetical protein